MVELELEAPVVDIVGFQHEAQSAGGRAAIDAVKARLSAGEALFVISDTAGCDLERATVELLTGGRSLTRRS
ncbi:MAG: DUF2796 domain-containing protein [Pseudomonadota bacterium]